MTGRPIRAALAALLAFSAAAVTPARAQAGAGGDAELPIVAKLEADRDQADGELLKQLAAFKSPSAAKALVGFYGKLASLWMKREVLRVLREFDGVVQAGNTALDHVATVAANATEPELRDAAFDTLEHCPQTGRAYLAKIVELPVQQQVRERALELHAAAAGKEDAAWYRKLFDDDKLPHKLREHAFEALAKSLDAAELQKFFHDVRDGTIRRMALEAMQRQKTPGTAELALETVKQVNVLPTDRAHAASVLVAAKGAKAADDLIEVALQQATTQWQLRGAIADLLVALNDPAVNKKLLALVGQGKPHEQWFALLATRHLVAGDEKLLKKVRATLDDKDSELRRVAIRIVGEQKDAGAADLLEKELKKPKDPGDAAPIILALSRIRAGGDKAAEWEKRLVEISKEDDRDRRNAALQALLEVGDKKHVPLFAERLAHPDWTTRMLALQSLEKLRDRDSVGAIIARMPKESGRMLLEFAGTLFRLTGEPHDDNAVVWKRWWDDGGKDAPLVTPEDLEKKIADREKKRLQQTTSAPRFFGVKIESHDVAFVVDVSGSMAEQLETTKIDGKSATRLEVVKQELVKSLRGLDASALFNLITFSSGVTKWKEGVVALSDKTRAEAIDYVGHLGSRGGTNIYDALQAAFADPKVDTIFLLTDGEPSQGGVTDLQLIREHVARLNETRRVRIHCIGVGGDFPLLEWLAQDAGGTYVKFD
jgi:HEAT repeat protein